MRDFRFQIYSERKCCLTRICLSLAVSGLEKLVTFRKRLPVNDLRHLWSQEHVAHSEKYMYYLLSMVLELSPTGRFCQNPFYHIRITWCAKPHYTVGTAAESARRGRQFRSAELLGGPVYLPGARSVACLRSNVKGEIKKTGMLLFFIPDCRYKLGAWRGAAGSGHVKQASRMNNCEKGWRLNTFHGHSSK